MIFPERVFGTSATKQNVLRPRDRADFLDDVFFQLGDERRARDIAFLEDDECRNRLALQFVQPSDDRRLGDLRMVDERALDFHRPDAVARDVNHVIHSPEHPEIAVLIALGAVTGESRSARSHLLQYCVTNLSGSP
jgi:hypothetical protein